MNKKHKTYFPGQRENRIKIQMLLWRPRDSKKMNITHTIIFKKQNIKNPLSKEIQQFFQ
jgi:hypothetical protein